MDAMDKNQQSKETSFLSKGLPLTKKKEEQHPCSFLNPLNVLNASDHTIHRKINSRPRARCHLVFFFMEKNVSSGTLEEQV